MMMYDKHLTFVSMIYTPKLKYFLKSLASVVCANCTKVRFFQTFSEFNRLKPIKYTVTDPLNSTVRHPKTMRMIHIVFHLYV